MSEYLKLDGVWSYVAGHMVTREVTISGLRVSYRSTRRNGGDYGDVDDLLVVREETRRVIKILLRFFLRSRLFIYEIISFPSINKSSEEHECNYVAL